MHFLLFSRIKIYPNAKFCYIWLLLLNRKSYLKLYNYAWTMKNRIVSLKLLLFKNQLWSLATWNHITDWKRLILTLNNLSIWSILSFKHVWLNRTDTSCLHILSSFRSSLRMSCLTLRSNEFRIGFVLGHLSKFTARTKILKNLWLTQVYIYWNLKTTYIIQYLLYIYIYIYIY